MRFQVGDHVSVVTEFGLCNDSIHEGDTGFVCDIVSWSKTVVGVAFDKCIDGHNCDGTCENGHGWFIGVDNIMLSEHDEDNQCNVSEKEVENFLMGVIGV